MSIKSAVHLAELRVENNYTREHVASLLDVSEQKIAKWENGEEEVDDVNCRLLAKIYHVSVSEIQTGEKDEKEFDPYDQAIQKETQTKEKSFKANAYLTSVMLLFVLIVYLLLGFFTEDGFRIYWTLFFLVPIAVSLSEAIYKKRFCSFLYPLLVTFIYLFVGMYVGIWHPTWILFVTIPLYYSIFAPIDHKLHLDDADD